MLEPGKRILSPRLAALTAHYLRITLCLPPFAQITTVRPSVCRSFLFLFCCSSLVRPARRLSIYQTAIVCRRRRAAVSPHNGTSTVSAAYFNAACQIFTGFAFTHINVTSRSSVAIPRRQRSWHETTLLLLEVTGANLIWFSFLLLMRRYPTQRRCDYRCRRLYKLDRLHFETIVSEFWRKAWEIHKKCETRELTVCGLYSVWCTTSSHWVAFRPEQGSPIYDLYNRVIIKFYT